MHRRQVAATPEPVSLSKRRHMIMRIVYMGTLVCCNLNAYAESTVPSWQIGGFIAALQDSHADVFVAAIHYSRARQTILSMSEESREIVANRAVHFLRLSVVDESGFRVRSAAVQALSTVANAASGQVPPQLAALLDDDDSNVREASARALATIGAAAIDHAPKLATLLDDDDSNVREASARALATIGAAAIDHAPKLATLLDDDDSNVREASARALATIGAAADHAPKLAALLDDDDSNVREASARALATIGAAAIDHAPKLAALLDDNHHIVREASVQALTSIASSGPAGEHAVVPLITPLLLHDDWRPREAAAQVLGTIGAAAIDHAPKLAALLDDDDSNVREASARALATIGAAADHAPKLAALLDDDDSDVREASVQALTSIASSRPAGEHAVVPLIIPLLSHDDWRPREAAAQVLGTIGAAAIDHAPKLAALLDDDDSDVREASVQALTSIASSGPAGEHAVVPLITPLLSHDDWRPREAAAQVLGTIGVAAIDHAPKLAALLDDDDSDVREASVQALTSIASSGPAGEHAVVPLITPLLSHDDWRPREAAAQVLGTIGVAAIDHAPKLAALLDDDDSDVREASVQALTSIASSGPAGEHAVVPLIIPFLSHDNWRPRKAAAQALGTIGAAAIDHAPKLAALLDDQHPEVREASAQALGAMGSAASHHERKLVSRRFDSNLDVRIAVARALRAIGVIQPIIQTDTLSLTLAEMLAAELRLIKDTSLYRSYMMDPIDALIAIVNPEDPDQLRGSKALYATHTDIDPITGRALLELGPYDIALIPAIYDPYVDKPDIHIRPHIRFWSTLLTAGSPFNESPSDQIHCVLTWIDNPHNEQPSQTCSDVDTDILRALWPALDHYVRLRNALESKLVAHLSGFACSTSSMSLAREVLALPLNDPSRHQAVRTRLRQCQTTALIVSPRNLLFVLMHSVFWAVLMVLYPRYPIVQATFFWNPLIRRFMGLGYVGLLLAWIPILRRRLFSPFSDQLLADARLDELPPENNYYSSIEVKEQRTDTRIDIATLETGLRGITILEGESGLGKTWFLRHLVAKTRRLTVFIDANACHTGVMEAIQAKIEGHAKDVTYLKKIIYSGKMDIVVDGLNEVSIEIRTLIARFAERFSKGNMIISTQPMQWSAPRLARTYVVQPLRESHLQEFLTSRMYSLLPTVDSTQEGRIRERCRLFLTEMTNSDIPEETRLQNLRIVSNPMELSVISQLLIRDEKPNLHRLFQQHYEVMARDYARTNQGLKFPLNEFANHVYRMRCNNATTFDGTAFRNELFTMAEHRMVIPRQLQEQPQEAEPLWTFRQDKIMDYFLVHAFSGADATRFEKHLGDSRFGGTYLLLALLMPQKDAESLREMFVYHAADTNDHSISDSLVQIVRSRKATEAWDTQESSSWN